MPRYLARLCVGPESALTQIGDSAGEENLPNMADLSNSSNMMALEGLPEELLKNTLCPHCYRVTEQGVIMVKISVEDVRSTKAQ